MFRYLLFICFLYFSFSVYSTSHDYEQYVLHFDTFQSLNLESLGGTLGFLSIYIYFIQYVLSYINDGETFGFVLWALNWISIFYFFIYNSKNKFNFWFLLSYFILFTYLWHSNQLRQGIIIPAVLYIYITALNGEISKLRFLIYSSLLSFWHLASVTTFFYFIKRKIYFLIPFFFIFSLYFGGSNTLINFSSLCVLIAIMYSVKKRSKTINFVLGCFLLFMLARPYSAAISSRMLELSLLSFPLLLNQKNTNFLRIFMILLCVLISLNNSNFFS